jgi:hypothetical protein
MRPASLLLLPVLALPGPAPRAADVATWSVFETSFETSKRYPNSFVDVEVNVVFTRGDRQ